MAELKYWIWMNELGINPVLAHRVMAHLGGPMETYFAEREKFAQIPGLGYREIEALSDKDLRRVYKIQDDMLALGGRILTWQDAEYPQRLRDLDDAPSVLYVRGNLPVVDDEAAIAIVGTRKCSPYGERAAKRIAGDVARHGGLVVTGLAKGIDAAAAEGALKEGGEVIGVLGCGLERVYPPENKGLFEEVLQNGALVSEYPPGTDPVGHHFPRRNRIITGLSVALVVVEIPTEKSGAMRSVNHAVEQGRDVFVVPSNIDAPASMASNALIDEGFQSASTGWRILRDYTRKFSRLSETPKAVKREISKSSLEKEADSPAKIEGSSAKKVIDKGEKEGYIDLKEAMGSRSPDEQAVIKALGEEPVHIDDIIAACSLPPQTVNACLTTLTIAGYIRDHAGKRYSLRLPR